MSRIILPELGKLHGIGVYMYNDVPFVVLDDIEEPERSAFKEWMNGQTMPYIPEVPGAVYPHDWDVFHLAYVEGKVAKVED